MQKIVKGLFFDLDGTLCDTDQANFEAYSHAFADEGFKVSIEDFVAKTLGHHADHFIPILAPGISPEATKRVREMKKHYYGEAMHFVKPNAELISFLRVMTKTHITVLVTTAQSANAAHVLKAANIDDLFDHRIFGDDVSHPKPDPEAYERALSLTGLRSDEVIAFEDSPAGIDAAIAAGIKVVKVKISEN